MELILELLYVRRRIRIEWKQMICAVILALLCVGLYGYANTHLEDAKEKMEERQTASAKTHEPTASNSTKHIGTRAREAPPW